MSIHKTLTNLTGVFVLLIVLVTSCTRESEIAYPTPLPSGEFTTFLPGVVSIDSSFEFNSLYSPDGKTFYFSKNEIHDIYETTFNGTKWSEPALTSFSEKEFKECDPAFSPDGNKLFYISTRKRTPTDSTDDFDIWFVERQ